MDDLKLLWGVPSVFPTASTSFCTNDSDCHLRILSNRNPHLVATQLKSLEPDTMAPCQASISL